MDENSTKHTYHIYFNEVEIGTASVFGIDDGMGVASFKFEPNESYASRAGVFQENHRILLDQKSEKKIAGSKNLSLKTKDGDLIDTLFIELIDGLDNEAGYSLTAQISNEEQLNSILASTR